MGAKNITGTCLVLKKQRSFVRTPFNVKPDDVNESDQDAFLEMNFDSGMKIFFKHSIQKFWSQANISYPRVGKLGLNTLLAFA